MTTRGKGQGRPTMTKPSPLAALVTKKRATKKTKVVPTKALTAAVQKIVGKTQETKLIIASPTSASSTLDTFIGFNGPIASVNEIYDLIPAINQGTGDHNRVGNVIQPTSLTVRGICSLQSNSSTSQRCVVDIYVLTSKMIKSQFNRSSILINRLLNLGNGNNTDYNGTTLRAMLPINTSEFTVLRHKRIVLSKNENSPNSYADSGTAAVAASSYAKPFAFKVTMPKKLTYQTDAITVPSNYYPFMVIGWNYGDNNGGSFGTAAGMFVQAQSHLYFKDA